jgi:hypothetical protein
MPRRVLSSHLLVLADLVLAAAVIAVGIAVVLQTAGGGPLGQTTAVRGTKRPVVVSRESSADPTTSSAEPSTPPVAGPQSAAIDAYRGLGSWVDIYDDRAWAGPAATVTDMARHGVRTLYIETANSNSSSALHAPSQLAAFIVSAHSHQMRVVAWYLPDLTHPDLDYSRIEQAIHFTTPGGQRFDSFALDIESHEVSSQSARNSRLSALSARIRALVGPSYPLGAIIPSPVGLAKAKGGWTTFPYASVARTYDVILPMSYYTYHVHGAAAVYADTAANVRILRSQPGCAQTPIHLIGGISEDSSVDEADAFARASRDSACYGASLYGWTGTSAAQWRRMSYAGW